ncbi:MAG: formate--tetrahydrofolate ligase [Chloroflexi bacterium]|nr:formate--tetrahydrofolate ligase [Chloroflexota bacterium]|tara:strand:- start:4296 stop:5927 length:1632 start_codon:yes stop_codon:yes gene_type:complete
MKIIKPIEQIAEEFGIGKDSLEFYGKYKAKIPLENIKNNKSKLIVVTAITPTPLGEGKSTTAIGLTQGFGKINKNVALTIRQPSLGPVFGHKGGGTGGGKATVEPAVDINLHFNGDFHAMESAHNFLAAMVDNSVYRGVINNFYPENISWRRVTDAEDRSLRSIVSGVGGSANAPVRTTGFDISAASEIMAILALTDSYKDLRERLDNIVVGWKKDKTPVLAKDINAVGSMMALLRDAIKPNLAQTVEGQPAIVHMGPFGNIAHGCSSILADQLASSFADYVITEAGFGADLGFEKFMDIKVRQGGPEPFCAVIVCTIRGLKWHGGVEIKNLNQKNNDAIIKGSENLINAMRIVSKYGLKHVVAINIFPEDSKEEINLVKKICKENNSVGIESNGFSEGGEGMIELAEYISDLQVDKKGVKLLYEDSISSVSKVEKLAKEIYSASNIDWGPRTRTTLKLFESQNWNFPICMAKTHLSVSANPKLRGAPTGHTLPIKEVKVLGGAKQIVTLAGDIITLPGLPSSPNAFDIDLNDEGEIINILST